MNFLLAVVLAQGTLVASAPVDDEGIPPILNHFVNMYVMCRDAEVVTLNPRPSTIPEAQAAYRAAAAPCEPVRTVAMTQAERMLSQHQEYQDVEYRRKTIADAFEYTNAFCNLCSIIAQGQTQREPQ